MFVLFARVVFTNSRAFVLDRLWSSEKKSWKWNDRIPEEIAIKDLTRPIYYNCRPTGFSEYKVRFRRRILHVPNKILILVDSNEYVRLIWFKRRIFFPNKIAERERRV